MKPAQERENDDVEGFGYHLGDGLVAAGVAASGNPDTGNGGNGADASPVFGTGVGVCGVFAGGGGGGRGAGGAGGPGGGGTGELTGPGAPPTAPGTANTGGGGGGVNNANPAGGVGGSGVVIVKQAAANPTHNIAPGVWSINDVYDNVKAGTWSNG